MYVIRKLRLNRFRAVPIQSARRLFELFGLSAPKVESQQTAEDLTTVVPYGAKKTQVLDLGVQMAEKAKDFAENPESTKPLPQLKPREK